MDIQRAAGGILRARGSGYMELLKTVAAPPWHMCQHCRADRGTSSAAGTTRHNPEPYPCFNPTPPSAPQRTTQKPLKESLKSLVILTMFLQTVHNQTQHVVFACLSSRRLLFAVFLHLGISRACLAFSKLDKLS